MLAHARALLTSTPEGATAYIDADARDPDTILREAARVLDFDQPIALMLLGIVNFIVDDHEAHAVVERLLDALPSGSYMAMVQPTHEFDSEKAAEVTRRWNQSGGAPIRPRSRQELTSFFEGLELLEPGVVSSSQWRPDPAGAETPAPVSNWCGVGRKP